MKNLSVRIFLILFGLFSAGPAQIRTQNRVQLGLEQDNNVLESLSHAKSDQSARLLLSSRIWWQLTNAQVAVSGQVGLQGYRQTDREHKTIQQVLLSSRTNVLGTVLGAKAWARNKVYFNKNHDYFVFGGSPFWSVPLFGIHTLILSLEAERLTYPSFQHYNYGRLGLNARWRTRISRQLLVSAVAIKERYQVDRPALRYLPESSRWDAVDEDLENRELLFGFSVDWYSGVLVQSSLLYGTNQSNSQGSAFRRWILSLNMSREFKTVLVRFVIHLQDKTFTDDYFPDLPLDIDTEREESNFVIFDLSFPVLARTTLLGRISWYRNESPFPFYYYDKVLFDMGLEYRF